VQRSMIRRRRGGEHRGDQQGGGGGCKRSVGRWGPAEGPEESEDCQWISGQRMTKRTWITLGNVPIGGKDPENECKPLYTSEIFGEEREQPVCVSGGPEQTEDR
jgi:hypothetical protein